MVSKASKKYIYFGTFLILTLISYFCGLVVQDVSVAQYDLADDKNSELSILNSNYNDGDITDEQYAATKAVLQSEIAKAKEEAFFYENISLVGFTFAGVFIILVFSIVLFNIHMFFNSVQ